MDRIIYATAIEEGLQLVTKDERMRNFPYSRQITIW
jgi:PIN domain nuclease of toxin-antitoxin system